MSRIAFPYWHVDGFGARPFTGNQAAVMLLESWLDDATLTRIAAENNFAETAFLLPDRTSAADWDLRWFTPVCEIRMCGHATLAAGHVLLARDGGERVTFRTRLAGVLEVRRLGDAYALALPAIPVTPGAFPEAVAALGADPREIHRNADGYNLFVFASAADVLTVAPNFHALAALGDDQFICTAPGAGHASGADVVSRVFVPGAGIDEDSVTGSAHAVLTRFWAARLGRENFTAHQASARGGDLTCRLDGNRAWLGGNCVTVVEGTFYLSG